VAGRPEQTHALVAPARHRAIDHGFLSALELEPSS
jgi:hypothetical protein